MTTERWTCELHRIVTTADCPKCDDEQVADLERSHLPSCHACRRTLDEGEQAWASDWTVLKVEGTAARWVSETRYTCDDCEAAS